MRGSSAVLPEPHVYDLFAVPASPEPLDGGQGGSVRAGDLVLSPGRDAESAAWLNPLLAPLAAELDHERPRSIRLAMPIPTRDLQWVVDGWGATRFEPNAVPLRDLDALLATGRLLHALWASRVPTEPDGIRRIEDRWRVAERVAFGEESPGDLPETTRQFVSLLSEPLDDSDLGPDQLVHGDLAGNVLLDADGIPLVIDVAPYWRPAIWAEAVCVLDAVMWLDADPAVMADWAAGPRRQAILRAAIFRILSDVEPDVDRYRDRLRPVAID